MSDISHTDAKVAPTVFIALMIAKNALSIFIFLKERQLNANMIANG